MAVTLFDLPQLKTTCGMQTSWLYFIEPDLVPIKVLHCGNMDCGLFLLLWPWPWPDDLHIRTWPLSSGAGDNAVWSAVSISTTCAAFTM